MNVNSVNAVSKYNYSNLRKNSIRKDKKGFSNVLNNQMKNKKVRHIYSSSVKHVPDYKKDYKAEVFDISNIAGDLSNPLESKSVEAFTYRDISSRVYRIFMKKPNSNEKITIDIVLKLKGNKSFKNEEIFKDSIEKAIMLVDKEITIKHKTGDSISDFKGIAFDYNGKTGEFDFKLHIDALRSFFEHRLNGSIYINEKTKEAMIQELNDFIFEIFEES
ncbi:hypothetical protein [Dethiothermospora halolimnae]|uniref:hypothetical protein n=1 Tax=Dethiothermospora halolimnae TaxID=3114390 RepID=UPI003CCBAE98